MAASLVLSDSLGILIKRQHTYGRMGLAKDPSSTHKQFMSMRVHSNQETAPVHVYIV